MATRSLAPAAVAAFAVLLLPLDCFSGPASPDPRPRPYFELNVGQVSADAHFLVHGRALKGALTTRGVVLWPNDGTRQLLRFVGARFSRPYAEELLAGRVHYLIGNPSRWRRDVPTYGRVRYEAIYPGIDLLVYGAGDTIEYDLIVAPGADPRRVRFALEGVGRPRLHEDGSLVWTIGRTELIQGPPVAYQTGAQGRKNVVARYQISKDGDVRVELGPYDRAQPLIIDPTLTFSGYVHGGRSGEYVSDVAVDGNGNIYVTGLTGSTDLATPAAFDRTHAFDEGYVTKLDPSGTTVIWATYIGGSSHDETLALAVNAAGNAYVTGHTISVDFPTTAGGYDRACDNGTTCVRDGFVLKLSTTGSSLVYSTFIGGAGEDRMEDIGVDAAGRAHVAGVSASGNYPITAGAFIGSSPGGSNVVHTTLNGSGTGLAYSTYLGGSGSENRASLAVRTDGSRVVMFATSSTDVPTVAPIQPALNGSWQDAFVTSFGPTATVQFATYFGGSSYDQPEAVATGPDGGVYLAVQTNSTDAPNVRNYGPVRVADILVAKMTANGQQLVYVSRIGGSIHEETEDIIVDRFGRAIVTGSTYSPDFPTTPNAVKRTESRTDAFLLMLGADGAPTYSTLFGGSQADLAVSLAASPGDQVVIGGWTFSTNLPVRNGLGPSPEMVSAGGGWNEGFLARFAFEPPSTGGGGGSPRELVLYASTAARHGAWALVSDSGAAGGQALHHPNAGAARVTAPLASPTNYFDLTFTADAGVDYRLWIRGKADGNVWPNDSVYAQFSDSVDAAGAPRWRIGTILGTTVQIERCSGCGLLGWGWNDNDGSLSSDPNALGPAVRFAASGTHTIRIQTREDGLRIDQVVLSAQRYLTTPPGAAKNDTTVLTESDGSGGGGGPVCSSHELVLHAVDATVHGGWQKFTDSTAASNTKVRHPNAGAARITTPLAAPTHYVELTFFAEAGVPYRMWIRGKADANSWQNDSAYIQFSDSVTSAGAPTWRIATTSATTFTLENCSNCFPADWGWNDNDYGGVFLGTPVRFASTGMHTIRIQTREDGLALDQVVLSAKRFFDAAPGGVRNDATILPKCTAPPATTTSQ